MKYKYRSILYTFHKWRYYCRFAKSIDPTLYNSTRGIEERKIEQNPLAPVISKIQMFSAGSKVVQEMFKARLRWGWDWILLSAKKEIDKEQEAGQMSKFWVIQKMVGLKQNVIKKCLAKWRNTVKECKEKEERQKEKLQGLCLLLGRVSKICMAKSFIRWRSLCVPKKLIDHSVPMSENANNANNTENIEDDEDSGILKPNSSGKLNSILFESAIENNANKMFELLKSHAPAKSGIENEEGTKKRISDLCVDMAIDFINTCLNH